jgi:methionyl-tRNA formyltransferase
VTKILKNIVFMGTPEFALPALERLVRAGYRVRAVYTQPDRPAGRGRQTEAPPVKRAALALGLPVCQPERLNEAVTEEIAALSPDALVVAAYGQLLPPALLASAPWGALNLHPSLLPRHRGAAPVAASILAGDAFGGVSVMQLDAGLDSGPVYARAALAVSETETTPALTGKLARLGAALLHEVLSGLPRGGLTLWPQDAAGATYFKALTRQQGLIDWSLPAAQIARQVRALQPWPGSYTFWRGQKLEILAALPLPGNADVAPGTVLVPESAGATLAVQTGAGQLGLLSLKLAGKRAQPAAEFGRGQRDFTGSVLAGSLLEGGDA